jgi:hypothetical protein
MSTPMSSLDRVKLMDKRLRLIDAGDALEDMPLGDVPRVVLHMFPSQLLEGADLRASFDLSGLSTGDRIPPGIDVFQPVTPGSFTRCRLNDDGLVTYAGYDYDIVREEGKIAVTDRAEVKAHSYLQVFHTGVIEAVQASYYKKGILLLHRRYEKDILAAIPRYLSIQQAHGVELPVYIRLSVTGVMGCYIGNDKTAVVSGKITSPQLRLPEVSINSFTSGDHAQLAELMREPFYKVWQAAGMPRSMNYDGNDEWVGVDR